MARDVCADCEKHFPRGEGLKDGLCPDCRKARGLDQPPEEETPPEPEKRGEEE